MMFVEGIGRVREERKVAQERFTAALEIDTAVDGKDGRRARRGQVLTDRIAAVVTDEKELSNKMYNIAKNRIREPLKTPSFSCAFFRFQFFAVQLFFLFFLPLCIVLLFSMFCFS